MELLISTKHFENQKIHIYNNLGILVGSNGTFKTHLLSEMVKGFKGQQKQNFKIDNAEVFFVDYQVVYLKDDFQFSQELKVTKTSQIRDELVKYMSAIMTENALYYDLQSKIAALDNEISSIILKYFSVVDDNQLTNDIVFKTNTTIGSIEQIIDKLLQIELQTPNGDVIEEGKINKFFIRMLLLKIQMLYLNWEDKVRKPVIVLDLPFIGGDTRNAVIFAKYLSFLQEKGAIIILTVNEPGTLKIIDFDIESLNFVDKFKILKCNNVENVVKNAIVLYSYLDSNYTNILDYKNDIMSVIEEDDIKNEYVYFKKNIIGLLVDSLFTDCLFLSEDLLTNSWLSMEGELLILNCKLTKKDFCFLLLFYLNFKDQNTIKHFLNTEKLIKIMNLFFK